MKFTKMQGAGNDYIYIDARGQNEDWSSLSRKMSDRHFGIGSDGLILIQDSEVADLKMRMFNADGSEGEMCGNGIRCFTKYAIDHRIVSPPLGGLNVDTMAGIRRVEPVYQGQKITGARVSMGVPAFDPERIPVILDSSLMDPPMPVLQYPFHQGDLRLLMGFVSMGNPHAVTFLDQPVEDFPLHQVGPLVERDPMFPRRVNFEIVNRKDDRHLTARVWERGSGETMACGTGACAIAAASRLLGYTGNSVDITLPGGTLIIDWDGEGEVYLTGPAEEVFSGEWMLK
ncbi:MAG TPA: diaminopimelate epimerase [Dehalococcoidia bacterium]|nr:diaminopimelate epimerase [Dehalococcoidia bacterium]